MTPINEQNSDIIESHWPNWLAQDNFLQPEVNELWINYYKNVQKTNNRYLAKNTEQFYAQWLYNKYATVVENSSGVVEIDNSKMPNKVYKNSLLGNMVLKVKLNKNEHISKATIDGKQISCYFEDAGFGNLPICVAKTQFSISHGKELGPAPRDYIFKINDAFLSAGAGFIVLICGNISVLPSLPSHPRALDMQAP